MRRALGLLALLAPCGAGLLVGSAPPARARAHCVAASPPPAVVLTREAGKNGKLQALLAARAIPADEVPCIAFERLPSFDELGPMIGEANGWVVITSPEAASVFLDAWRSCGRPPLSVASVGAATAQALAAAGLEASFVPSKATAKTLAAELPPHSTSPNAPVLYPCSARAQKTLENGLLARGMATLRVETYTTVGAEWDAEAKRRAAAATVVTFASPSAVKVWAERVGTAATAVCIGETSAAACREAGFASVLHPAKPGVEAWAETVASLGLWTAHGA